MAKIIIDISDAEYNYFMSDECFDADDGFDAIEYICNGKVLPDNATNGDVIKEVFINDRFYEDGAWIQIELNGRWHSFCPLSWWNAPYDGVLNNDTRK